MKKILLTLVLLLTGISAQAKLTLGSPISDGMVLQQSTSAAIWGNAAPGAQISISASWGASAKCKADADGHWRAAIKTPSASYKSYTVKISGDGSSVTVNDVLVGEVWFASGQSNMEMPMRGFFNCPVEDANEYIAQAPARDKIRMFTVPTTQSFEPQEFCKGYWAKADASTRKEMSATAYFFALKLNSVLDVPVGIVACPYGGARVESWTPREILETYPDVDLSPEAVNAMIHYVRPLLMYNAMLYPLRGYTVKGFIWYQGCSNVGADEQFVERMSNMVAAWRSDWGDENAQLPFYQVEIAPYQYKGEAQYEKAPALRQAQHVAASQIPNSAIVVTDDLAYPYERDNIHPCQKKPVGDRLAYLALHRDYGYDSISCYSPEAVELIKLDNSSEIGVKLTNCPNGIDRWIDIQGLEVAGSEGIFFPVTYAYYEWSGYLRVRSEFVFDPCEVRYCWGDFKPGNLHNCEGLPVAPFWLKLQK